MLVQLWICYNEQRAWFLSALYILFDKLLSGGYDNTIKGQADTVFDGVEIVSVFRKLLGHSNLGRLLSSGMKRKYKSLMCNMASRVMMGTKPYPNIPMHNHGARLMTTHFRNSADMEILCNVKNMGVETMSKNSEWAYFVCIHKKHRLFRAILAKLSETDSDQANLNLLKVRFFKKSRDMPRTI